MLGGSEKWEWLTSLVGGIDGLALWRGTRVQGTREESRSREEGMVLCLQDEDDGGSSHLCCGLRYSRRRWVSPEMKGPFGGKATGPKVPRACPRRGTELPGRTRRVVGPFWEERHKNEFQTRPGGRWASAAPSGAG